MHRFAAIRSSQHHRRRRMPTRCVAKRRQAHRIMLDKSIVPEAARAYVASAECCCKKNLRAAD
jgi:hypothetical protein